MTKEPVPGEVLTRLAKDIGVRNATDLYECFLNDIFRRLQTMSIPFIISCNGEDSVGYFKRFAPTNIIVQRGDNLGSRIYYSLQDCFNYGYEKAVVIGSDSPDIPLLYIDEALAQLSFFDVVLGPSDDGGYYLVGFRIDKLCRNVFKDINWSSKTVWEETLRNLAESSLTYYQLNRWYDIDTEQDLMRFYVTNVNTQENFTTINYMKTTETGYD